MDLDKLAVFGWERARADMSLNVEDTMIAICELVLDKKNDNHNNNWWRWGAYDDEEPAGASDNIMM